ncbi:hypothetical protein AB3S75_000103 [Citrus x aurantiifolia]
MVKGAKGQMPQNMKDISN